MKKIFFLLLSTVLLGACCSEEDITPTPTPTPTPTTPVSSVLFDQTTTPSSVKVGESVQLTVTITPEGATDKTIIWSSSDTEVATVTDAGVVTAKKAGTATITATASNGKSAAWTIEVVKPNLLPGKFTVAEGKTVQFTKSNLYWDGSAFKFEANQTDYQTSWDTNHVSHFYWTKTAAASYAESYDDGENSTSDVPFFAESKGGLTVEGTEGLYALSSDEWTYLLETRTDATNLRKDGVSVAGNANCLIIAPDGFTGTLASSYTAEEWTAAEASGLVCLPAAGTRNGSNLLNGGREGRCWSSSSDAYFEISAKTLYFFSGYVSPESKCRRSYGCSLRLVK